jgi:hypothetical protein
MKTATALGLLLALLAGGAEPWTEGHEKARTLAAKEGKPLVLVFP